MEHTKINLAKETSEIKIKTYVYNINVYTDNIPNPIVFVKGDVILENNRYFGDEGKYAKIEENNKTAIKTKSIFKKGFFSSIFSVSRNVVVSKDGKVTVNGYLVSDDCLGEIGSIDLVIPKGKDIVKLIEIETMSGSISAKDLNIGDNTSPYSFTAKTISGNITLDRFQAQSTNLEAVSGNISAEIYESFSNYETELSTLTGKVEREIKETKYPQSVFDDRYFLKAESISGNIKVLFKGKN